MTDNGSRLHVERRSFFSRLGTGLAAFGATMVAGRSMPAQAAEGAAWQPVRHPQDEWLDQVPGKHRLVFDTTSPLGLGNVLLFATNYYTANQSGYMLTEADMAVVIVVRHNSTMFGYNDAMWAKYAAPIAKRSGFEDPQTKQPAIVNVFTSTAYTGLLPNRNNTLTSLTKRGVQLAVCQMATRAYATSIAEATGGTPESVYSELTSNLLPNARLVPAGIVAVNRAQERGYALAHGG